MKKVYLITAVILLSGFVFIQKGLAQNRIFERPSAAPAFRYVPGEIIVKFKPGVTEDEMNKLNSRHSSSLIYTSPFAGFRRLRIPPGRTVAEMVELYKRNPNVQNAEANYYAYALTVPNDTYYQYQWNMDNPVYGGIHMEQAWDIQTGSSGVVVAVVDTGIAYENYTKRSTKKYYRAPDLAGTVFVAGYDFVESDNHPNDDNGHGTHVTGTIAQTTNNGTGCAGIAFNTAIMPVKVLDKNGSGTYADVADGIMFAANNGAKVINLSLGGSSPSDTLKNAVQYAYEKGVTVIAAAGNDSAETVSYPAAYDAFVIAVGATRYDETVSDYSSYYSNTADVVIGRYVDITAPGGDLNVDQNGDGYGDGILQNTFNPQTKNTSDFGYWFFEGTSMAAPHVSGVAALLIAQGVAVTPGEVRAALQETAEDKGPSGWDPEYGWGIVNAYAALCWTPGSVDNPPQVTIVNPSNGSMVSGNVSIQVRATDDNGVNQVECCVDGGVYQPMSYNSQSDLWEGIWGSSSAADGRHTITAKATDTAGQTATDTAAVTVDNTLPVVNVVGPAEGATVSGTITIKAGVMENNIDEVEYQIDGGTFAPMTYNAGSGYWEAKWNSTTVANNNHTVTVRATDQVGNTGSDTNNFKVNNPVAPTAYVSINMSKQSSGLWRATSAVGIRANNASGLPVSGATVTGSWSGLYQANVTGVTDRNGQVSFRTPWLSKSGTVTFTATKVVKNNQTYLLSGNVSGSIKGP
jgi:serine protease